MSNLIIFISLFCLIFFIFYKVLRTRYDKGLENNGVTTVAFIDDYGKWDGDFCCFFHFFTKEDNRKVYGRTIVYDIDCITKEFPKGTMVKIMYDSKKPKNWRFILDNGYYVKV